MSTHLITGFAGKEHITAADQGSFNAAVMGGGEFVLERGEQFRCQVISNNKVRIYDGDVLMQGRHIIVDRNTYEETTHENGTQGYLRNDLIVLTYEKNSTSGVETAKIEVIKGTPAESNPTVPEYVSGDILDGGALKNQMPLYKVPFNGLSIGTPVKLFSTVPTLEGMKKEVDSEVDAKMTELYEKFNTLSESVDEKIADAGKPLSSDADDWGLIENYGEYSADAKTVGEEFTKVNNSLGDVETIGGSKYTSIVSLLQKWIDDGVLTDPNLSALIPIIENANESIIASANISSWESYKPFDNIETTGWIASDGANNNYIGFKFDNAKIVKKIFLKYGGFIDTTMTLQASNDGSTWTDLKTINLSSNGGTIEENIVNEKSYTYYRLFTSYVIHVSGSGSVKFYTLQMYGE